MSPLQSVAVRCGPLWSAAVISHTGFCCDIEFIL